MEDLVDAEREMRWSRMSHKEAADIHYYLPLFREWGGWEEEGAETEELLSPDGEQDLGSVYMPLDCSIRM